MADRGKHQPLSLTLLPASPKDHSSCRLKRLQTLHRPSLPASRNLAQQQKTLHRRGPTHLKPLLDNLRRIQRRQVDRKVIPRQGEDRQPNGQDRVRRLNVLKLRRGGMVEVSMIFQ